MAVVLLTIPLSSFFLSLFLSFFSFSLSLPGPLLSGGVDLAETAALSSRAVRGDPRAQGHRLHGEVLCRVVLPRGFGVHHRDPVWW